MKRHNVKTLSTLRQEFGETDSKISFLKLDVEGWEIDALQRWADSEEEKGEREASKLNWQGCKSKKDLLFFFCQAHFYVRSHVKERK